MDYDNVDYFPRRGQQAGREEAWQQRKGQTIAKLNLADIFVSSVVDKGPNDSILIFREPGKPTIDYNLRRNRWKIRGAKKDIHGTVEEFIAWYRQQREA